MTRRSEPATTLTRPGEATAGRTNRGRISRVVAGVEESFLFPCQASPRREAWIAAYGALALPVLARGRERFGVLRIEGEPVRLVALGLQRRIRALLGRWFDQPLPRLENGTTRCLWRPADCMRFPAELRVAEIHEWAAPGFRRAGWRIVPDSVRWAGNLRSIPPASPSRSLRSDLRNVQAGGFEIVETRARADWETFFSNMVRPAAIRRFGEKAWIPSPSTTRAFVRAGTLLLLRRGGTTVAGVCVIRTGRSLWVPVLAVTDPGDSGATRGVGAALYKLTFDWARGRGIEWVDMGRTSPHIDDPIAWYKRKWGFHPTRDPLAHRLAVWIDAGSPAHRAVARSPVYVEAAEGLIQFPDGR